MKLLPVVVGTRGRIALPHEVREQLGLVEGDTAFFVMQGDEVRLVRSPDDFDEYLALYRRPGGPAINE